MGIAGLPFMAFNTFHRIQEKLYPKIMAYWEESRKKAYGEEQECARARGDIDDDGKNIIAVVMDGGWYTRTIGKGGAYNSKAGNTVIRSLSTGKVLEFCVKLKSCGVCDWWKINKPEAEVRKHLCFKNHDGTPQSMEKIGLAEGLTILYKYIYIYHFLIHIPY